MNYVCEREACGARARARRGGTRNARVPRQAGRPIFELPKDLEHLSALDIHRLPRVPGIRRLRVHEAAGGGGELLVLARLPTCLELLLDAEFTRVLPLPKRLVLLVKQALSGALPEQILVLFDVRFPCVEHGLQDAPADVDQRTRLLHLRLLGLLTE